MDFYKFAYLLGFVSMLLINLKTKNKYKLRTNETVIITIVTYICGVVGAREQTVQKRLETLESVWEEYNIYEKRVENP